METQRQEASLNVCPECGGERVHVWCARPMEVRDKPYFAQRKSLLKAILCTQCGLTSLYAARPAVFRSVPSQDEWFTKEMW